MRILMAASTAAALLVSTACFAATAGNAAPPAASGQQMQAAKPHKVVAHRDRDVVGDRETAALNSLEASGYYSVKDIRPDGRNVVVDAKKPGADFTHLTVLPNGTIRPAGNPAT